MLSDRVKRYFFDSATGLLATTQYTDERLGLNIETRFPAWQNVQGSSYPTRIERFENGQQVFAFTFDEVGAEPRQDPRQFPVLEEPVKED
jgi:hypothetical protein